MLEVWSWPTPNGHKVHIALEELGLEYKMIPVNIGAGDQFKPEFLKITPNHRIPAIVDPDGPGGKPFTLFESRRDPDLPVGKDRRQADPEGPDRPLQMPRMDHVPDGRGRADVRPVEPFRRLCAGKGPLRDRALHQRGEAADPGAEPPARGDAVARRRRIQHGRHHHLPVAAHRHASRRRVSTSAAISSSANIPAVQALVRRDRGPAGGAARSRGAGRRPRAEARSPTPSARSISARRSSRRGKQDRGPLALRRAGGTPAFQSALRRDAGSTAAGRRGRGR